MTRDEAIYIRSQQLSGKPVDAEELAEALVAMQLPEPPKKRGPKPGTGKGVKRGPRVRNGLTGLLAARDRVNRVLIAKLLALRGVVA